MARFGLALFGYSRGAVNVALAAREARIGMLESEVATAFADRDAATEALAAAEAESADLSAMVIEREREIRTLGERLAEAATRVREARNEL